MSCWSFSYGDLLERNARLFGELPAVLCRDECVTHRDLYARALALAGGLAAMGVQAGDRLAVPSENRHKAIELLGAAPRMVFVSPHYIHLPGQLPVGVDQVVLQTSGEHGGAVCDVRAGLIQGEPHGRLGLSGQGMARGDEPVRGRLR